MIGTVLRVAAFRAPPRGRRAGARLRATSYMPRTRVAVQARESLAHNRDEVGYLKEKVERLSTENRVLRREQRTGKRDDVILQLEVELETKEGERAEMEEQLSAAFGGVIKELQARVTSLQGERDALLVRHEQATKPLRR